MANKPKQQGTARETAIVNVFNGLLGIPAQRSPNNAPSRDVDALVGNAALRIEVKDRERLSVHKTVNATVAANPDNPTVVAWHCFRRASGNTRRTSMGTVWCVPEDVMHSLLTHAHNTGWDHP